MSKQGWPLPTETLVLLPLQQRSFSYRDKNIYQFAWLYPGYINSVF